MRKLFICSSVFQVFNIINIIENNDDFLNCDLMIINYGTSILKDIDVGYLKTKFHDVTVKPASRVSSGIISYLNIITRIFGTRIQSFFCKKYNYIYLTGTEVYSKIYAFMRLGKKSSLYYYEDGLESYDSVLDNKSKKGKDKIFKILYGKSPLEFCSGLLVYDPTMVVTNDDNKKLIPIMKMRYKDNRKCDYRFVYRGKAKPIIQSVVFLEAWFNDKDQYQLQAKLLSEVLDICGIEKVCIKPHPNELNSTKILYQQQYKGMKCFEVNNYFYTLEGKLLISIISTASITPKILFEEEPYVLFLYKIFMKEYDVYEWHKTEKVINIIKQRYRKPNRIIIPNSIEEMRSILLQLKGENFR